MPAPAWPSRRSWQWATTVLRSCSGLGILAGFCSPQDGCWPSACFQEPVHGTTSLPTSLSRPRPGTHGVSGCIDGGEPGARPQACCLAASVPLVLHVLATGGLMLGSCLFPQATPRSELLAPCAGAPGV